MSDLCVRGEVVLTDEESATLRRLVGDDLLSSATLRAWFGGATDLPPHSVAVALEAQLRMLFGEPAEACDVLTEALDRLAEAFPAECQPL